jgi:hypothetical protein
MRVVGKRNAEFSLGRRTARREHGCRERDSARPHRMENIMGHRARHCVATALLAAFGALASAVEADVSIVQVYSSPDGEYQAILLEDDVDDGVDRFRGVTLVMEDDRGGTRFATLASGRLLEAAVDVHGRRRFLAATPSLGVWLRAQAELPDAFLDTAGGTIAIFGGGAGRRYPALDESDAHGAIAFDPMGRAVRSNFALASHPKAMPASDAAAGDFFALPAPAALVREYRSVAGERYRLAITQHEKAALDTGREPGWRRTGRYFRTLDPLDASAGGTVPVCRYYLPPPHGDTRIHSAHAAECAAIARAIPGAILEARDAFRAALPHDDGSCPAPLKPLYRSWNGLSAANHRMTTDLPEHADMLARGWIGEGAGTIGTAMCVDPFAMPVMHIPKQRPRVHGCADC